jgi:hypothetical protein
VPLLTRLRNVFRRDVTETTGIPAEPPERRGFEVGIPVGGLNEYRQTIGTSTQTDRHSLMQELYEAYLTCPWAWASVQAIARTITAGGLVTDWDTDTGEGDEDEPDKPESVLALERLIGFVNPQDDIRQLLRVVVTDLLVFGDAFVEVTWVGATPVALYNLDSATMYPQINEHGTVTGYVQVTEFGQRAAFEPREVIHISLDAPRAGAFGVSPTQAALLPITAWLFAAATGKEMMRKGLPATLHVDMPASMPESEINRWVGQHMQRNVGARNIGRPIVTRNGGAISELQAGKSADVESFLSQKRDEIIACYGAPPSKVMIIESGNLGGGTGEAQDKTFRINTCQPIAELVLEKLNYAITRAGFGIQGWHMKFRDVDYRDSAVIEDIRDQRLRNGAWTLNRYRTEIGEPPVDGGSDAVLVDRQNLVLWSDMAAMSKAGIAGKGAAAIRAGASVPGVPMPPGGAPGAGPLDADDPDEQPAQPGDAPGDGGGESMRLYRARLHEALARLPTVGDWEEAA